MAQWKQTLEPYVKVIESVKSTTVNPTAGGDLIIGAVIISDAGPTIPTLITSQKEFLSTFAASELTKDYTDSLDELYTGDNKTLASTMWLNAYRLSGSGSLLISRACKADGLIYAKPLEKGKDTDYILKDNEILRAAPKFKLVLDLGILEATGADISEVTSANDGWAISIKDIGVIGNRVNDNGPLYDYYVDNLYDLVQKLNETTKFYSPEYHFYSDARCENEVEVTEDNKSIVEVKAVMFDVVYLAGGGIMEPEITDAAGNIEYWGYDSTGTTKNEWGQEDSSTGEADIDSTAVGCAYIIPETPDGQTIIDLNGEAYSGFTAPKYYASNLYNSRVDLKVRIRRFNHNAVQTFTTSEGSTDSPYTVLTSVLDVYTKKGTVEPSESILEYDFYEFLITDSSVSSDPLFFNVGNVGGRGDITTADLNNSLGLIYLTLPQNLKDLGLNYYGYADDNKEGTEEEINVNLKIGGSENTTALLMSSDSDIMKAWDHIEDDERYVVEGMTDLGCTETIVQNYMANIAVNSNYFYAVSTVNSTNYMVIASKKQKITQNSRKLWFGSPWDYDDGNVGYLYNCSPSVLYWETVLRNKRNNKEFAAAFGQNTGTVTFVSLAKEFKKTERQLLLTKKINTIYHDVYNELFYWNDNVNNQSEDNVMKEENNVRLEIRISKAMPILLNQFKGYQNSPKTRAMVCDVIDYWFKTTIMGYGSCPCQDYQVICDSTNNSDADVRANRLNVTVNVRYYNSVKYISGILKIYENAGKLFRLISISKISTTR